MSFVRISSIACHSSPVNRVLQIVTLSLFLVFVWAVHDVWSADILVAEHSSGNYFPGKSLTVTNRIEYTGSVTALGIQTTLPEGWHFVALGGSHEPDIRPGRNTTETLDFAWITPPASPLWFTYTLFVPAQESGAKKVSAVVFFRRLGGELREHFTPDSLIVAEE